MGTLMENACIVIALYVETSLLFHCRSKFKGWWSFVTCISSKCLFIYSMTQKRKAEQGLKRYQAVKRRQEENDKEGWSVSVWRICLNWKALIFLLCTETKNLIWSACMSSEPNGLPLLELLSPVCSSRPKIATGYSCFSKYAGLKIPHRSFGRLSLEYRGQTVHCSVQWWKVSLVFSVAVWQSCTKSKGVAAGPALARPIICHC